MKSRAVQRQEGCFLESDPGLALVRCAMVEGVGSFLLMFVNSGSGTLAQGLSDSHLLNLFVGAVVPASALAGLIIVFERSRVVISTR
jgi:hypothetical protein